MAAAKLGVLPCCSRSTAAFLVLERRLHNTLSRIRESFSRDHAEEIVNLTQTKKPLVTHVRDPTSACQLITRASASEFSFDTWHPIFDSVAGDRKEDRRLARLLPIHADAEEIPAIIIICVLIKEQ